MATVTLPLSQLELWLDPVSRSGPENMAVDEWLLQTANRSVLRVYGWEGSWASLGCFSDFKQAQNQIVNVCWVRRLTGGGIVDHQDDWTYTLVIPHNEDLARAKGAESYRVIHQALSFVLNDSLNPILSDGSTAGTDSMCFRNPVCHDVIDGVGNKLAGAGQRRSKEGLLHQGSVAGKCDKIVSIDRSKRFSALLATNWTLVSFHPPTEIISQKVAERYGCEEWTRRR
jgi:Lipoate-protein ligase A